MANKWIKVDPESVNKPKKERINGVEVTVLMSPYDVPDAIRGRYDDQRQRFIVEFRYLGEEPTRDEPHRQHVILQLGKNSGRLYGIILDVDAMHAEWVKLIMLALEEHQRTRSKPQRLENYQVAGQLLQQHAPELRQAMPA